MSLELGIGVSAHADVLVAGQEAAKQMVEHLGSERPGLVLVFSSIRFADARVLKGVRSVTGGSPLIGCSDAGGIRVSGASKRAVTVIGLGGEGLTFHTSVTRGLATDPEAAGLRLSRDLNDAVRRPDAKLALLFSDGLTANNSALLRGLVSSGWKLPVVGGAAADDFFFQRTYQFFNDEVLTDAATAAVICGDLRVGVGVRHGWMPLGRPRKVTRAQGHVIYQLDHRPAVSIYEDYLGIKKEELLEDPLAQWAMAYPLGTAIGGQQELLLRDAIRVGKAGSLICTGEIGRGSAVRLMIGGYESALEAAQQAAHDAIEQIGRQRLKGAIVLSSAARQKMLGSEYQGEIDVVRDALGGSGVRMGGFYTYGEFAPLQGAKGKRIVGTNTYHNDSLVILALG
jgi:hypothetical protein